MIQTLQEIINMETPYYQSIANPQSDNSQTVGVPKTTTKLLHTQLEQRLGEIRIPSRYIHDDSFETDDANSSITIRIEQPIAHPVDPLCWLHANIPRIYTGSSSSSTVSSSSSSSSTTSWDYANPTYSHDDPPTLYLANAEETMEASVFGSSHTIRDLNIIDDVVVEDEDIDMDNNSGTTAMKKDSEWDWIKTLPHQS